MKDKKKTLLDNYNLCSLKNSYFHIKSISVLNSQSSLRKGQWLIKLKLIRSSATANIWMIIYKQSLINLSWQNKELASAWTNYVYVLAPQLSKKDIPYSQNNQWILIPFKLQSKLPMILTKSFIMIIHKSMNFFLYCWKKFILTSKGDLN